MWNPLWHFQPLLILLALLPFLLLRENRSRQAWILALPATALAIVAFALMRLPFAAGFLGAASSVAASLAISLAVALLLAVRLAGGRPLMLLVRASILMAVAGPVSLLIMGQTGGTLVPAFMAHLLCVASIAAGLALSGRRCRRRGGMPRAFLGWTVLFSALAQMGLCVAAAGAVGVWLAVTSGEWAAPLAVLVGGVAAGVVSGLALAALVCTSILPAICLPLLRTRLGPALGLPERTPPPPPAEV